MKMKLSYAASFLVILCTSISFHVQAEIFSMSGSIAAKHSGRCLEVANNSSATDAKVLHYTCQGKDNQQWTVKYAQDGAYKIIVRHSNLCLSVRGASLADDAEIVQASCSSRIQGLWLIRPAGDYFQIVAKHSNKCLNVLGSNDNNGVNIVQSTCTGVDSQQWTIATISHTAIQAKHSRLCLDVKEASTADGAGIIQYDCQGNNNQQWTLLPYANAYRLVVKHTGKCISVPNGVSNDAQLVQSTCTGANNELFYPRANENFYELVSKLNSKCLSVNNSSTTAGAKVIQSICRNSNSQRWKIDTQSTTGGKWSSPIGLSIVPTAAANLPNGQVLLWSSHDRFSFGGSGQTYTVIYDPWTKKATERLVTNTGHDMFCPGTSNLPDGRILVNGGVDSAKTSIYDPASNNWSVAQLMNIPRGYQSNVVLSNGDVFTLGGSWNGGLGFKDGEIWNANSGWRKTPGIIADAILTEDHQGIFRSDNHGWFFSVDNQKVFHAGPSKQMNWFDTNNDGNMSLIGTRSNDDHSMNGNAVLYDVGRILKVGGAAHYQDTITNASVYHIDINNGVNAKQLASMSYPRAFHTSVVLPNGQVIVFGGQGYSIPFNDLQSVFAPELWDPNTKSFTTLNAMRIPRNYHGFALLLPDARVLVGGSGLCGDCETNHPNAEIFTPPYLLTASGHNAARPSITKAPTSASYGTSIAVQTNANINQFVLVRLSSVTHTINNDLRRIPLTFGITLSSHSTKQYTVNIPNSRGIVTPGYYMLFALNSEGVPSEAKIIKIA